MQNTAVILSAAPASVSKSWMTVAVKLENRRTQDAESALKPSKLNAGPFTAQ